MRNKTNILITCILVALIATGSFFLGRYSKKNTTVNQPVYVENGTQDTLIPIFPKFQMHDTLYKYRTITLPGDVDSTLVYQLFNERDQLRKRLDSMKIKSEVVIDTLYGENKDTLKLRINDFSETIDIYLGLSARKVTVPTKIVYLPAPKREWWDNPYVPGAAGLIVGFILGVMR